MSKLQSAEGDLLSFSISIDPWHLESLLDTLGLSKYPINPSIRHGSPLTTVEFPGYEDWLPEIRRLLTAYRFDALSLRVRPMLAVVSAGLAA